MTALKISRVAALTALAEEHRLAESDTIKRKLTDRAAKSAKPPEPGANPLKLADGGGLILFIPATGQKVWHYRYTIAGKERVATLGGYPEVSLAVARSMHRAARWLVERGEHPLEYIERKEKEAQEAAAGAKTLRAVCHEWLAATDSSIAKTSRDGRRAMLRDYVMLEHGDTAIAQISRKTLVGLLTALDAKVPVTAQHCRRHLNMLFEYACNHELVPGNPVPGANILVHNRRRKVVPRKAMQLQDVPDFLATLAAATETHPLTKLAFRLLVLTWCRTAEVIGARWDELDLEHANWTIPAPRMKNRIEHCIRLPRQAVELLREAEKWKDPRNPDYVFPSRRGSGHMSRTTLHQWLERWGYSKDADVHGFRAVARTWAAATNAAPDVVCEYALAHQPKSPTQAAYDREKHAGALRKLWQSWADEIDVREAAHRGAQPLEAAGTK